MTDRIDATTEQTTKPLRWEGDRVGFVAFQYNRCSLDSSTSDGAEQIPSPPTAHPHNPNITDQPLQKKITPTKKITFFFCKLKKNTHTHARAHRITQNNISNPKSSMSSTATKYNQIVVPERRSAQMGKAEAGIGIFSDQGGGGEFFPPSPAIRRRI